ncbi:DUF3619 family protein [Dechloromonas sp. A34]|uniref:DUF3619 family protein n=1 Tax=Dechloromonas sp. A34 TaxID=447588 RepID=UPI0022493881|nr:DUF3619 family protein [Dechloromonas sp. A34]
MNEEHYGYRIRQALNHGLKDIPPSANRRLEAARHLALSKQKQAKPQLALAGGGTHAFSSGSAPRYFKQTLSVIALLLGMWLSFYWHSVQYVTELQDVDSALLADDLPPEAFLDNDFFEWLKDDSSED